MAELDQGEAKVTDVKLQSAFFLTQAMAGT